MCGEAAQREPIKVLPVYLRNSVGSSTWWWLGNILIVVVVDISTWLANHVSINNQLNPKICNWYWVRHQAPGDRPWNNAALSDATSSFEVCTGGSQKRRSTGPVLGQEEEKGLPTSALISLNKVLRASTVLTAHIHSLTGTQPLWTHILRRLAIHCLIKWQDPLPSQNVSRLLIWLSAKVVERPRTDGQIR